MKVFESKKHLNLFLKSKKNKKQLIGFVPTMGALHKGHISLVKTSISQNNITVVSIFVNPTQFNNQDDLIKYPRTLFKDIDLLKNTDANNIIIYHPSATEIYDGNINSEYFEFDGLEFEMEGKYRPGHFDGVGTIVKKLFEIVQPDNAYFGEKDFQQLQIIKKLVENENMNINIIPVPIFRENDGLAMSSRNTRLTPEYRGAAPFIYQTLQKAKEFFATQSVEQTKKFVENEIARHPLLELEYFEIANEKTLQPVKEKTKENNYRGFIVVFAGDVRLIDNISL